MNADAKHLRLRSLYPNTRPDNHSANAPTIDINERNKNKLRSFIIPSVANYQPFSRDNGQNNREFAARQILRVD